HGGRGRVTVPGHQGGAAAEVEVDLETGRVEVLRMHANCYAGRVVSPLRVRQQNQGCAVFGLGPTLFEELHYQDGTLTNPNLSDYMIPSILDVPAVITSSALEAGDESAELHGVGEMALPAVAPAVADALFAATGARIDRLPLTPERGLRALGAHDPVKEGTGGRPNPRWPTGCGRAGPGRRPRRQTASPGPTGSTRRRRCCRC